MTDYSSSEGGRPTQKVLMTQRPSKLEGFEILNGCKALLRRFGTLLRRFLESLAGHADVLSLACVGPTQTALRCANANGECRTARGSQSVQN